MEQNFSVLLYSKYSDTSKQIMNTMNLSGVDFFKIGLQNLCIDNKEIRNRIIQNKQINITSVPCILVVFSDGIIEKYEGVHCFKWIDEIISSFKPDQLSNKNIDQQYIKRQIEHSNQYRDIDQSSGHDKNYNQSRDQNYNQNYNQNRDQDFDQDFDQKYNQTRDQNRDQNCDKSRNQTRDQNYNQTRDQNRDQTRDQNRDQNRDQSNQNRDQSRDQSNQNRNQSNQNRDQSNQNRDQSRDQSNQNRDQSNQNRDQSNQNRDQSNQNRDQSRTETKHNRKKIKKQNNTLEQLEPFKSIPKPIARLREDSGNYSQIDDLFKGEEPDVRKNDAKIAINKNSSNDIMNKAKELAKMREDDAPPPPVGHPANKLINNT